MLSETVLLTIGLGCVAALLGVALFGAMKREFKRISAAFGAVPTVVNTTGVYPFFERERAFHPDK